MVDEAARGAGRDPLEAHLTACVQESLALYLFDNATFLGERLVAEFPSEENVYLLATAYHRANQTYRAYHMLKGLAGAQSRYLFAVCCMQLGKHTEAEAALMPDNDITRVPNGAAGHYLLGRIYQLSNRHSAALSFYDGAMNLDPMMWSAFEELCLLGGERKAHSYFAPGAGAAPSFTRVGGFGSGAAGNAATPAFQPAAAALQSAGPVPMSTGPTKAVGLSSGAGPAWAEASGLHTKDMGVTPPHGMYNTPMPGEQASGPPAVPKPPAGQGRPAAWANTVSPPLLGGGGGGGGGSTFGPGFGAGPQRKFLDEGKMRKVSGKLFVEPASILRQVSMAQQHPASDAEAFAGLAVMQGVPPGVRSSEGQQAAMAMLRILGEGYQLLCNYQCREAIEALSHLPINHYQTGWVLNQVGRANFELVDYPEAAKTFQWARQVDPYRLEGLEVYSTVLWHMKREVELSYLAQEAVTLDRQSPYAWCVMGNCFSLQKEHETALRFFQRALQLDPTMPYAYTLSGHEYFANEDFDKGITCYRNAIRIDPRHYNAWFGMGHIYFRQEKFGMAEYHFRRALTINPGSSVLRCYLGMAVHKLGRNGEALALLQRAIEADPRNPLARFEKSTVLMAEEKHAEALRELQSLKDIAPREASVLFHMGKIYKRLDQIDDAMTCFCAALDLQPPSSDTNLIKSAIERIKVAEEEEEEEITLAH